MKKRITKTRLTLADAFVTVPKQDLSFPGDRPRKLEFRVLIRFFDDEGREWSIFKMLEAAPVLTGENRARGPQPVASPEVDITPEV